MNIIVCFIHYLTLPSPLSLSLYREWHATIACSTMDWHIAMQESSTMHSLFVASAEELSLTCDFILILQKVIRNQSVQTE